MSPSKLILGLACIVGVAIVGTYVSPSGGPNPDTPHSVEWEFETADGELRLSHRGGMAVPRESLSVTVTRNGTVDERIPDLASTDHPLVGQPFSDEPVTRGDTLVLAEPDGHNIAIDLLWEGPNGSSTLATFDYSPGED